MNRLNRVAASGKVARSSGLYWILFASTFFMGVVFIEPAPVDMLALMLITASIILGWCILDKAIFAPVVLLILFICANALPFLYVRDAQRSLFYALITVYLVSHFYVIYSIVVRAGGDALRALLHGWIAFSVISAGLSTLAIMQIIPSLGVLSYLDNRALGFFKGPNVFASFIILPIALLVYCYEDLDLPPSFSKLRYPCLLVLLVGLALSGSRAGWINAAVTLALAGILRLRRNPSLRSRYQVLALFSGTAIAVVALFMVLLASDYGGFLAGRMQMQRYDQERFAAQTSSMAHAARNPFGIGPGQSESVVGTASIITHRGPVSVHSLYVRVIVENGWVGAAAFFAFLGITLRAGWLATRAGFSYSNMVGILFAAYIGLLVNSIVIDSLHWRHFWLQTALLWALYSLHRRRNTLTVRARHEPALASPPQIPRKT